MDHDQLIGTVQHRARPDSRVVDEVIGGNQLDDLRTMLGDEHLDLLERSDVRAG